MPLLNIVALLYSAYSGSGLIQLTSGINSAADSNTNFPPRRIQFSNKCNIKSDYCNLAFEFNSFSHRISDRKRFYVACQFTRHAQCVG